MADHHNTGTTSEKHHGAENSGTAVLTGQTAPQVDTLTPAVSNIAAATTEGDTTMNVAISKDHYAALVAAANAEGPEGTDESMVANVQAMLERRGVSDAPAIAADTETAFAAMAQHEESFDEDGTDGPLFAASVKRSYVQALSATTAHLTMASAFPVARAIRAANVNGEVDDDTGAVFSLERLLYDFLCLAVPSTRADAVAQAEFFAWAHTSEANPTDEDGSEEPADWLGDECYSAIVQSVALSAATEGARIIGGEQQTIRDWALNHYPEPDQNALHKEIEHRAAEARTRRAAWEQDIKAVGRRHTLHTLDEQAAEINGCTVQEWLAYRIAGAVGDAVEAEKFLPLCAQYHDAYQRAVASGVSADMDEALKLADWIVGYTPRTRSGQSEMLHCLESILVASNGGMGIEVAAAMRRMREGHNNTKRIESVREPLSRLHIPAATIEALEQYNCTADTQPPEVESLKDYLRPIYEADWQATGSLRMAP